MAFQLNTRSVRGWGGGGDRVGCGGKAGRGKREREICKICFFTSAFFLLFLSSFENAGVILLLELYSSMLMDHEFISVFPFSMSLIYSLQFRLIT